MAVLLALASALTYGVGDFLGGLASRRAHALRVLLVGMPASTVVALPVVALLGGDPWGGAWRWGVPAGIAGGAGVALFFYALAVGRMSVVSPVTALTSSALPVVAGLALGESLSGVAALGVGLALVAVVLISREADETVDGARVPRGADVRGLGVALLAGSAFGVFFVLLDQAPADAGAWPALWGRLGALALVVVAAAATGRLGPPPLRWALVAVLSSSLDFAANVFFLLATREGQLVEVAVVAGLYPAGTVLLARVVLREHLAGWQLAGLALAAVGVVALAQP